MRSEIVKLRESVHPEPLSCVVYSSARILRNSLMGYAPVMLIFLSWNTRK